MHTITSVAADTHNTMYGSQVNSQVTNQPKWQIQQQEIISLGYEFPRGFTGQLASYRSHSSPGSK